MAFPLSIGLLLFLSLGALGKEKPHCRISPFLNLPIDGPGKIAHLTAHWHLEFIGADLAKKFVRQKRTARIDFAVVDMNYAKLVESPNSCQLLYRTATDGLELNPADIHGYIVSSFFAGPAGATADDSRIHSFIDTLKRGELERAVRLGVRVFNYSKGPGHKIPEKDDIWHEVRRTDQWLLDEFSRMDSMGAILVTSAGNEGDFRRKISLYLEKFPGVVVGAMYPNGDLSSFSNYSEGVILAPGSNLLAEKPDSTRQVFAGTSISAPLVAGSIVNALEILPELTRGQIQSLLQKTGIKLPYDLELKTAPSMINSLKLVRVADRLRQKLNFLKGKTTPISKLELKSADDHKPSPSERESFIAGLLKDPKILDFSEEARSLEKKAQEIKIRGHDCAAIQSKIELLREAVLLDSTKQSLSLLSELYQQAGYAINAQFYSRLAKEAGPNH